MGQLEKYGLYVLCLVIFLILGVAIWGGEPQASGGSQALALAGSEGQRTGSAPVRREPGRGPVNSTENLVDMFARSDLPKPPAKEADKADKGDDKGGEKSGEKGAEKGAEKGSDKGKPAPGADTQRTKHQIKAGDTLDGIAKGLGSSALVAEIKKLNPGVQERNLKAGTELVLPSKAEIAALLPAARKDGGKEPAKQAVKEGAWRWYKVQQGDTYEGIAKSELRDGRRFDAIMKLNPTIQPKQLRAGMEIKVPVQ